MKLVALNGHAGRHSPWRGALVLVGEHDAPGVLLDPTGALAARLDADPMLCQRAGLDSRVHTVVLTAARIDQVAALIGLRHGATIDLYTTPAIFEDLSSSGAVLPELQRHCDVHWRMVPVAGDQARAGFQVYGQAGLQFTAVAGRAEPHGRGPAIALGLEDSHSGGRAVWLRSRHRLGFGTGALLEGAGLVVVEQDELEPDPGLVAWLAGLAVPRKLLLGGTPDTDGQLACLGIEQPHDGLEIQL